MSLIPDLPLETHGDSHYSGRKIRPYEHLLLAAYWFGSNFLWGAFLGPVLSSEMTRLRPDSSAEMLGLMYAVGAFPALIIPLIAGPLSDRSRHRWGRRRPFILGGGLLTLLGIGLMAFAFNALSLPLYLGGYLVIQIGANTALGAYSGVIPDLVPSDQRGVASGYMALMSQLATLLGALASGFLIEAGHHMLMYGIMGGVFFTFIGISLIGIKEKQWTGESPPFQWGSYFKSLWIDPKKYPDFAWVWITRALMMVGFYQIQPYLLYYLRDVTHVEKPASTSAIVFGIILIAATISGFVGGLISDKIGRKPVVIYSSVLIAVTCILLIFCQNLNQALAVGVFFGLGYGAYISVDWALGTDVLPNKHDAGKDMAVWHISMTLPQQIAPLVAGMILGQFRAGSIMEAGEKVTVYDWKGYAIVFTISALAFLFGGILVKKVKGAR